ncbi:hypothetical protein X975_13276, partial [Stegodyphus mimosarum]
MVVIRWWSCLAILLAILLISPSANAFHMHKIMAAALLANSLNRNSFLPLPIPIPIPVKSGGSTIIALGSGGGGTTYIPLQTACSKQPCFTLGNDDW